MKSSEVIPGGVHVVAFDWDGTVVDSVEPKLKQNQALAAEFGNDLSLEQVRTIWNASSGFPDLMQQLCRTDDLDAIMRVVKRDYTNPEFAKRRFEFAEPTLHRLGECGYRLALVTNLTGDMLTTDSTDLELDPSAFFDYIQTVDMCEHKKPDGRVFAPLLDKFHIAPQELLYVGDENKDFCAAIDAGAHFIGVTTGMSSAKEFSAAGARFVKNIGEL